MTMGAPGLALAILKKGPKSGGGGHAPGDGEDRQDLALQVAGDFRKAMEEGNDTMVLETMRAMLDLASTEESEDSDDDM